MSRPLLMLMIFVTITAPPSVHGQQASRLAAVAGFASPSWSQSATSPLSSIPDSVRQKVGYHHWKGAAIGAGAGALAGLALALAAHGQCVDCTSDSPSIGQVTASFRSLIPSARQRASSSPNWFSASMTSSAALPAVTIPRFL